MNRKTAVRLTLVGVGIALILGGVFFMRHQKVSVTAYEQLQRDYEQLQEDYKLLNYEKTEANLESTIDSHEREANRYDAYILDLASKEHTPFQLAVEHGFFPFCERFWLYFIEMATRAGWTAEEFKERLWNVYYPPGRDPFTFQSSKLLEDCPEERVIALITNPNKHALLYLPNLGEATNQRAYHLVEVKKASDKLAELNQNKTRLETELSLLQGKLSKGKPINPYFGWVFIAVGGCVLVVGSSRYLIKLAEYIGKLFRRLFGSIKSLIQD